MADRLGVTVEDAHGASSIRELVGVALRRNPRRAHLLVSTVLGKHIPVDPRTAYRAACELGDLVATRLDGRFAAVLGYAETATGLGHVVADRCGSPYLHSTRRAIPGIVPTAEFDEHHSHATMHLLLPENAALLDNPHVLVLVDDELSTGQTAMNTIVELHALYPRERYLIASLVDVRSDTDRRGMAALAGELGVQIEVVSTARGRVHLPDDLGDRVGEVLAAQVSAAAVSAPSLSAPAVSAPVLSAPVGSRVDRVDAWPHDAREGGRHGFDTDDRARALDGAQRCARELASHGLGERILVLATEELMYAPLLIAVALADLVNPACITRFSSTTRSPVLAIDEPGYPIRTRLAFDSHDDPTDGPGERYAYNVAAAAGAVAFTDVVVVVDDVGDTPALHGPGGLMAALAEVCVRVHLVVLPSYRPTAAAVAVMG
jgi:hypothetical protein